jgi:hypothetical protein
LMWREDENKKSNINNCTKKRRPTKETHEA